MYKESTGQLLELPVESPCLHRIPFLLIRTADRQWPFRLEHRAGRFSRLNVVSSLHQGPKLTAFLANDKNQVFGKILGFVKLISVTVV